MTIIYDEPAATYHANTAIGSSDIRDYIRSPQLFRDRQDGVMPVQETPAMRLGTLTHLAMLEPGRFAAETVAKPEGMSFATKDGKAWRDAHEGKQIITENESASIYLMQQRMPAEVRAMLTSGKSEVTVRTKLNGIDCQCRVDHWDRDGRMKYDLKTIGAIEKIDNTIFRLGYHIQDRWYSRVIKSETGEKEPTSRFIFAETAPPYRWRVVQLDLDYIYLADEKIDEALAGIAARTKSGVWSDGELYILASPPAWAIDDENNDDESQ